MHTAWRESPAARPLASSVFRAAKDAWIREHATEATLRALVANGTALCIETGDGHYLRRDYPTCQQHLAIDKSDAKADVRIDLNIALSRTPAAIRQRWGAADVLVSHDVLEHLESPETAMAQFARLVREGGALVLSVPLMVFEHGSPHDYQRFTTQRVRNLMECAGFRVERLHGLGNTLSSVAYLVGATEADLSPSDVRAVACDASRESRHCNWRRFTQIAAIGVRDSRAAASRGVELHCPQILDS
eukprot:519216-Prymnesium_polylepis.1